MHLHAAGDIFDRRVDEQAALVIGEGQELAGGAQDDDAGHALLHLPVEEALPGRDVDGAAVLGEGRDRHGVAAAEILGHYMLSKKAARAVLVDDLPCPDVSTRC